MKSLLLATVCLIGIGCASKPAQPTGPASAKALPPGAAKPGSGDGIAPVGPNVGSMTPVVGGENLGGTTGGGVGQALKDRAKKAASSSSQTPGDGSSD